jgi:hypothetical protein
MSDFTSRLTDVIQACDEDGEALLFPCVENAFVEGIAGLSFPPATTIISTKRAVLVDVNIETPASDLHRVDLDRFGPQTSSPWAPAFWTHRHRETGKLLERHWHQHGIAKRNDEEKLGGFPEH